jgi:gliding motility-associated lipoprotein GldH
MRNTILILFIAFSLVSCDNNTILDKNAVIPESGWAYDDIPSFAFEIDEPNKYHDIFLNLQLTEQYIYSNIYLLIHLRDSEGKDEVFRMSFEVADKTGKWLGQGSGNVKTFKLPIFKEFVFEKPGQYFIGLEQNMRDSVLMEVVKVGVDIKKGYPVF